MRPLFFKCKRCQHEPTVQRTLVQAPLWECVWALLFRKTSRPNRRAVRGKQLRVSPIWCWDVEDAIVYCTALLSIAGIAWNRARNCERNVARLAKLVFLVSTVASYSMYSGAQEERAKKYNKIKGMLTSPWQCQKKMKNEFKAIKKEHKEWAANINEKLERVSLDNENSVYNLVFSLFWRSILRFVPAFQATAGAAVVRDWATIKEALQRVLAVQATVADRLPLSS